MTTYCFSHHLINQWLALTMLRATHPCWSTKKRKISCPLVAAHSYKAKVPRVVLQKKGCYHKNKMLSQKKGCYRIIVLMLTREEVQEMENACFFMLFVMLMFVLISR